MQSGMGLSGSATVFRNMRTQQCHAWREDILSSWGTMVKVFHLGACYGFEVPALIDTVSKTPSLLSQFYIKLIFKNIPLSLDLFLYKD